MVIQPLFTSMSSCTCLYSFDALCSLKNTHLSYCHLNHTLQRSSDKLHLRHILFSIRAICSERVSDAGHKLNNYYATPCFQFIYMSLIYLRCKLIVFIIQVHSNTRPLLHSCQNKVTLQRWIIYVH